MNTIDFYGRPKQVRWSKTIYQEFKDRFGVSDDILPDIQDASWWIAVRNITDLDELLQHAHRYEQVQLLQSPFTSSYPRYEKIQAIHTLTTLPENIAVLDTETTGLAKKGEICELSIVEYPSRRVLFNSLIKPHDVKSEHNNKAMQINGITWEELDRMPTLTDVIVSILSILANHHLAVFNADFDIPMLRYSLQKWGIHAPRLQATCVMKLATALVETDYYLSLDEACTLFDIDRTLYGESHRALPDTLATCDLLERLIHTATQEKETSR